MIRLALLLTVCSVTLFACKPGDSADLNDTLNLLQGKPLTTTQLQQVAAYVSSAAPDYQPGSVAVAALITADAVTPEPASSSSAAYVATAHETCDPPWIWRGVEQPGACSTSWY